MQWKVQIGDTMTMDISGYYCFPTSYADVLTTCHSTSRLGEYQAASENSQRCITGRKKDKYLETLTRTDGLDHVLKLATLVER